MLPKKSRLKIQEYLSRRGTTRRSPLFTLKAFPSSLLYPRFGAVVGKRVKKTAVGRNALRRMFLDCAGETIGRIPPGDYLIIVHPAKEDAPRESIYEQLMILKVRNKILTTPPNLKQTEKRPASP